MNTTKNNVLTTTYTRESGILTHVEWNDGCMRHQTLVDQDWSDGFVITRWNNISIFSFYGDEVYFTNKLEDGSIEEVTIEGITNVVKS